MDKTGTTLDRGPAAPHLNTPDKIAAAAARLTRSEGVILALWASGFTIDDVVISASVHAAAVTAAIQRAGLNREVAHDLYLAWRGQADAPAPTPARIPTPVPEPAPAEPPADAGDAIADLITRAVSTEVPHLVRMADTVSDSADALEAALGSYEQKKKLQGEAAELEARLVEIRAQLGTKPPTTKDDNRAIREWAAANGHACHDRGRVPASVAEAYQRAQPGVSS